MRTHDRTTGFTLLEVLVVVGLIASLLGWFAVLAPGSNPTAGLRSGQTLVANLVVAARARAIASGRKTRVLVHQDPLAPGRYLRFLVLQQARQPGSHPVDWGTIQTFELPVGVFVVPAELTGLVATPADWKRPSNPGENLASDLFAGQALSWALEGETEMRWTGVAFTANGTLSALEGGPPPKGTWLIARGLARMGAPIDGQAPVELVDASLVRGVLLSAYGIPALVDSRAAL